MTRSVQQLYQTCQRSLARTKAPGYSQPTARAARYALYSDDSNGRAFLIVPQELRDKIYDDVYAPTTTRFQIRIRKRLCEFHALPPRLGTVCRQMRIETRNHCFNGPSDWYHRLGSAISLLRASTHLPSVDSPGHTELWSRHLSMPTMVRLSFASDCVTTAFSTTVPTWCRSQDSRAAAR